mmetsp:Transcript_82711/g.256888  ORF Transcript_82711/g.256888 Transcript_82711/m.256888 type:complete len:222 (+) Transcript_82711:525-1190(+)
MVSKFLSPSKDSPLRVFSAPPLAYAAASAGGICAETEWSCTMLAATAAAASTPSLRKPREEPAAGLQPDGARTARVLGRLGSCTFIGSGMSWIEAVQCCDAVLGPATLSGVTGGQGGAASGWCRAQCRQSCADDATGGGGGVATSVPAQLWPWVGVGVIAFSGGRTTIFGVPNRAAFPPAGEHGVLPGSGVASKLRSSSLPWACRHRSPFLQCPCSKKLQS